MGIEQVFYFQSVVVDELFQLSTLRLVQTTAVYDSGFSSYTTRVFSINGLKTKFFTLSIFLVSYFYFSAKVLIISLMVLMKKYVKKN